MTFQMNIRFGHLDTMPRCEHGRIEGYCSNSNCGGCSSVAAAGEASDVSPAIQSTGRASSFGADGAGEAGRKLAASPDTVLPVEGASCLSFHGA